MDKIKGKKTSLSNWKMVERILRDLVERDYYDDPILINLCLVYLVHAWIRSIPLLEDLVGIPEILKPITEILRSLSRKILREVIFFVLDFFRVEVDSALLERKQQIDIRI